MSCNTSVVKFHQLNKPVLKTGHLCICVHPQRVTWSCNILSGPFKEITFTWDAIELKTSKFGRQIKREWKPWKMFPSFLHCHPIEWMDYKYWPMGAELIYYKNHLKIISHQSRRIVVFAPTTGKIGIFVSSTSSSSQQQQQTVGQLFLVNCLSLFWVNYGNETPF